MKLHNPKGRKPQKKPGGHTSKLKRNTEKQKTVDLDRAAQEFVGIVTHAC
jgi:hypothetical protein